MNHIFKLIVAVSLAVGLTSCLKDDEHFVNFAGVGYVAEIPFVANRSILKAIPLSAAKAAVDTVMDVNIASPVPPTQDIPVTVGLDEAALATYNTANKTAYKVLPSTAYTLTNTALTIPAGSRIGTVRISFAPGKVPTTGGPYALPLSIVTVPSNVVISANYRTQIMTLTLTK